MNATLDTVLTASETREREYRQTLLREYGTLIYQRQQTDEDAQRIQELMKLLYKRRGDLEEDLKLVAEAHHLEDVIADGSGLREVFDGKAAALPGLSENALETSQRLWKEFAVAKKAQEALRQRMADAKSSGDRLKKIRSQHSELLGSLPLVEYKS